MKNVINDVFVLLATKWGLAAEHDEHNDSHRPNVALSSIATLEYFWCDVIGSTVWLVHDFVWVHSLRQAKVNQLHMAVIIFLVKQEVFRFDISMANSVSVQIAQGVKGLLHDGRSLGFTQVLFLGNVVKQFTTLAQSACTTLSV